MYPSIHPIKKSNLSEKHVTLIPSVCSPVVDCLLLIWQIGEIPSLISNEKMRGPAWAAWAQHNLTCISPTQLTCTRVHHGIDTPAERNEERVPSSVSWSQHYFQYYELELCPIISISSETFWRVLLHGWLNLRVVESRTVAAAAESHYITHRRTEIIPIYEWKSNSTLISFWHITDTHFYTR